MQVIAEAHPNVALVKYWGKSSLAGNIPATPSLSITLGGLVTRTRITLGASGASDSILLDGMRVTDERIGNCVDRLRARAGFQGSVAVATDNDFPTSAGLASSASGFAALVSGLNAAFSLDLDAAELSREARIGSASAARSLHGGFVSLAGGDAPETWYAEQVADAGHWPLEIVVAVCSEAPKSVPSGDGMRASAATSPFYAAWVESAADDFSSAQTAVIHRDFADLARISEASCLKMHGLMLSTRPALIYWNPATVACIECIRALQKDGVDVFFTIDAGPQVKAVCAPGASDDVATALARVSGVLNTLRCQVGGPVTITRADP